MKKERSVIDKLIGLIEKRYKLAEKDFDKAYNLSENLSLINKVFDEDETEELTLKQDVSLEDFKEVVAFLTKENEEELINDLCASYFLMSNGIELVDTQIEKLRELNYRANIKRRSLKRSIERRENAMNSLGHYGQLEKKLEEIKKSGVLDTETIVDIFETLEVKEEEQAKFLNGILKFNYERIASLTNIKLNKTENEIEILEMPEEILDIDTRKITKEQLQGVFEKYNYDFGILNAELVETLLINGDLEHINDVFSSLEKNHIDFLKKNGKFLTKFLLESSSKLIDEGCKIFSSANVDKEFLKSYKPIFFSSPQEEIEDVDDVVHKRARRDKTIERNPSLDCFIGAGKHEDFLENLELLEELGRDRKYLLENQANLLVMSNARLRRHLNELKLYEFSIDSPKFPLSALSSPRIMEIADGFIELGEEKYILNYASRLFAFVDGTLERLYALKKENRPYRGSIGKEDRLLSCVTNPKLPCGLTAERINEIVPKESENLLKGNKFNELLNEYSPLKISEETLNDPIIVNLDRRYKNSAWSYNIDGTLISRKKLLRNYEFLMDTHLIPNDEKDVEQILLVSAIYKSKLNMSEVEKVDNGLRSCMSIKGGLDGVLNK